MRVELLKQSPAPEATTPPATTPATEQPVEAIPQVAESRRKLLDVATGWAVILPALLVALTVLAWSLVWRLPENNRLITVSAREMPLPASQSNSVSEADLDKLRQRLRTVSGTFIEKREDIGPLIARIEARAHSEKLWIEYSLKPAVVQQVGQMEFLRHPISIQLVDDYGQDGAAHKRFYRWLREAVTLDKRAEITSLRLRGNGAGLAEAHVELQLFSLISHEEMAAK